MKVLRVLTVILLPLLLCGSAPPAKAAAATGNSPTQFSSQKAARVAPWIALNQAVMQRLTASAGAEVKRPSATSNGANSKCGKNQQLCECNGKCTSITKPCPGCIY